MGAVIGSVMAVSSSFNLRIGNPYISSGISNLAGQAFSNYRNPLNTHISIISLSFSLWGGGLASRATHEINVLPTKMMIDSMFNAAFGSIGNNLGKKIGW